MWSDRQNLIHKLEIKTEWKTGKKNLNTRLAMNSSYSFCGSGDFIVVIYLRRE